MKLYLSEFDLKYNNKKYINIIKIILFDIFEIDYFHI